jgi:hypothetical protein
MEAVRKSLYHRYEMKFWGVCFFEGAKEIVSDGGDGMQSTLQARPRIQLSFEIYPVIYLREGVSFLEGRVEIRTPEI